MVQTMEKTKNIPELRFPEFEGDWVRKKLGEATVKVGSGSTPMGGETVYTNIGIPFIRSQNVINDNLELDGICIPNEINDKMKGSQVYANDILLNITGGSIGRSCVVPLSFKVGNVNQHVCIIRPTNKENSKFIQSFISSFRGQKLINQGQTGSGREGLNFQSIRGFNISFPTLPEQQKIASFLTAVDEKLNSLKKKKALLEQYKKGVMQKIFSQQIRFKRPLSEVEGDDNGKEFPNWEKKKLGDFLIPTLREVDKPQTNYLAIGVRSHCKGTFQKPDSEPDKIAMDKLFVVKAGDLIVNITFAWESAIAIVKQEDDGGLVSHRFPTYIFKENMVTGDFFQYVFIQKRFRQQLDLISPGGAGRNRVLSKKDFLKLECNIPCLEEQTKIANFLSAIDKKIDQCQLQIEQTTQWKKGLLQKMFC